MWIVTLENDTLNLEGMSKLEIAESRSPVRSGLETRMGPVDTMTIVAVWPSGEKRSLVSAKLEGTDADGMSRSINRHLEALRRGLRAKAGLVDLRETADWTPGDNGEAKHTTGE